MILFLGIILAVVFLALDFFLGGMVAAGTFEFGSQTMLFWSVVVALVMATATGFMSMMVLDDFFEGRKGFAVGAVIAFVVALIVPVSFVLNGSNEAALMRKIAPSIEQFAGDNFARIDVDGSGLITDEEMSAAAASESFNAEDKNLVLWMRKEQSTLGHITSTSTSTTYVWISTGNGGGYMSPITTTTHTYGISASDIPGYVERVKNRYRNW